MKQITCPRCNGEREVYDGGPGVPEQHRRRYMIECPDCGGYGTVDESASQSPPQEEQVVA